MRFRKKQTLLTISVAGVVIQIKLEPIQSPFFHKQITDWLIAQYGQFATSPKKPHIVITITSYPGILTEHRVNKKVQVNLTPYARYDWKRGEIVAPFHISQAQFEVIIKEILFRKIAFPHIFIHSSAICTKKGSGVLFIGPSGIGKSTISRNLHGASGVQKFADDYCIVFQNRKEFFIYQTPFIETHWNYRRGSQSISLTHVYILKRGKRTIVERKLTLSEAQIRLLPHIITQKEKIEKKQLSLLQKLVSSTPVEELVFSKNPQDNRSLLQYV